MSILTIIVVGFLVFLNIFSFLLVKCQKNDREKKILAGIAEGNTEIEFENKPEKPKPEEQQKAKDTLESMENKSKEEKDDSVFDDTENAMPKDKKQQKEDKLKVMERFSSRPVSDLKLFLCAILGGALGIYIALFVFKYRLRDITMMVFIPTILVLNIYIYMQVFTVWLLLLPFGQSGFIR